ncbi:hypothetical protein ACOWN7_05820 [Helicobacter pylori]|nr:hypothetical protein [Helicobacter pylori]
MHGFKPITERDGINPTIYDWFNLCMKSYRPKLKIVWHKNKKASNIFKIGVQFLSGWCKNAIKGFNA